MNYDYFINRFERRANKKRAQSYFFLGVSVVLIILLFFFLHSGMNSYKNLKTHIETLTDWTGELVSESNSINKKIDYPNIPQEADIDSLKQNDIEMLNSLILESKNYVDSIASLSQIVISTANKNSDNTSLLVDTSARILLALIGFFLIQIFLKLYRYNMETADFYTSIADSLSILKLEGTTIHGIDFEALTKLFRPSQIQLELPLTPSIGDPSSLLKNGA